MVSGILTLYQLTYCITRSSNKHAPWFFREAWL